MVLAGADVAMMASLLLVRGVKELTLIETRMKEWMEANHYASLEEMKGSMDSRSVAEPAAFERANYLKILQSY